MNQVRFRRPLQSVLLISSWLPLAAFSVACGGTSAVDAPSDQGASAAGAQGDLQAGAGGAAAASGHGDSGGSVGHAGGGAAGNGAGSGGTSGSGASAGVGGANAGAGGASAGSAGMGLAGSSGNSGVCHAPPPQICAGGLITLPKTCVEEAMAVVGRSLPIASCRTMCESMFTFSCSVSAVEQTSITVQCSTGCPASQQ